MCGEGKLDNVTLSTAEHLHHFYAAADWLTLHQDMKGGWPINVPRTVSGLISVYNLFKIIMCISGIPTNFLFILIVN